MNAKGSQVQRRTQNATGFPTTELSSKKIVFFHYTIFLKIFLSVKYFVSDHPCHSFPCGNNWNIFLCEAESRPSFIYWYLGKKFQINFPELVVEVKFVLVKSWADSNDPDFDPGSSNLSCLNISLALSHTHTHWQSREHGALWFSWYRANRQHNKA